MSQQFKVGDTIKITHNGYIYLYFKEAVTKMGLRRFKEGFGGDNAVNNQVGTVVSIIQHPHVPLSDKEVLIYGIYLPKHNRDIVMGGLGFEVKVSPITLPDELFTL